MRRLVVFFKFPEGSLAFALPSFRLRSLIEYCALFGFDSLKKLIINIFNRLSEVAYPNHSPEYFSGDDFHFNIFLCVSFFCCC